MYAVKRPPGRDVRYRSRGDGLTLLGLTADALTIDEPLYAPAQSLKARIGARLAEHRAAWRQPLWWEYPGVPVGEPA